MKKIVIALGGNAILSRQDKLEAHIQIKNIKNAVKAIAEIAKKNQVVICHGNGPQVGLLAIKDEQYTSVSPYPLDSLVANTQGMLGYWIQRELKNFLPQKEILTILTQVVVDSKDPAYKNPTKFIGPQYSLNKKKELQNRGWKLGIDNGKIRRVVASPKPKDIVEIQSISSLLNHKNIIICCGGGGIPVIQENNILSGIDCVIDKDHTSSLIAQLINADFLLILTDVKGIYLNWGTDKQKIIKNISIKNLMKIDLNKGSMYPKAKACYNYIKNTKKYAGIGHLKDAFDIFLGKKGTQIHI